MSKAIVVLSGGLDSCVTLGYALEENDEVAALHINYGQRTEKRELKAFNDICDYYKIEKRKICNIEYLKDIGGSSLTDDMIEIEIGDVEKDYIPNSYVPFRNTHILSIAVSWAEVEKFDYIYIGAVYEDSSGYPDTRPEYFKKFNELIKLGSSIQNIQIKTPIINMKKSEIVKKGLELNSPLELSWSCYVSNDRACGKCDSCLLRLRGFELAGYKDKIKYEEGDIK